MLTVLTGSDSVEVSFKPQLFRMKIAAQLGMKDEGELIEAATSHLRTIGVGHIDVPIRCLTDGIKGVLERCRLKEFNIFHVSDVRGSAESERSADLRCTQVSVSVRRAKWVT